MQQKARGGPRPDKALGIIDRDLERKRCDWSNNGTVINRRQIGSR